MNIVDAVIQDESVRLWVEDHKVIAAFCKSNLFIDKYADVEDLDGFDTEIEVFGVRHIEGLSNMSTENFKQIFSLDGGVPYVALELAFEFVPYNNCELVFKDGEFIAAALDIYEHPTFFIKCSEYLKVVTSLTKRTIEQVYVKEDLSFRDPNNLEASLAELKEQLMETIDSVATDMFSGENLKRLAMAYGGRSKFARKKRINIVKERLESLQERLNRYGLSNPLPLTFESQGTTLKTDMAIETINQFLPENLKVNMQSSAGDVTKVIKEIVPNLYTIKEYRFE